MTREKQTNVLCRLSIHALHHHQHHERHKMTALNKQEGGTHYKDMPIQPIEFITKNKLDWYQGNIVKYASRHHSKGGADDLRKVIHYAELALEAQYGEAEKQAETELLTRLEKENHALHAEAVKLTIDDDWIEWKGGDIPVGLDVVVEFMTANYKSVYSFPAGDLRWSWSHDGLEDDIVRYRVAK